MRIPYVFTDAEGNRVTTDRAFFATKRDAEEALAKKRKEPMCRTTCSAR